MPNGKAFDELRKAVEHGKDITLKGGMKLLMAAVADMHDAAEVHRKDVRTRLEKIEAVTKYPSALWYLANMPLKTLAVLAVIGLIMAMAFVPEARSWAGEQLLKTILGGF